MEKEEHLQCNDADSSIVNPELFIPTVSASDPNYFKHVNNFKGNTLKLIKKKNQPTGITFKGTCYCIICSIK